MPLLTSAEPDIPDDLDDRAADIWEPLLAIADLASAEWSHRARRAAIALTRRDPSEEESLGIQLLHDIRCAFVHTTRLFTEDLIRMLADDQESPWGEWWSARDAGPAPGAARQLARLLRPYGIHSRNMRIGEAQRKGYEQPQFVDAWRRYLVSESPDSVPSVPDGSGGTDGTDTAISEKNADRYRAAPTEPVPTGLPDGLNWPERHAESVETAVRADASSWPSRVLRSGETTSQVRHESLRMLRRGLRQRERLRCAPRRSPRLRLYELATRWAPVPKHGGARGARLDSRRAKPLATTERRCSVGKPRESGTAPEARDGAAESISSSAACQAVCAVA